MYGEHFEYVTQVGTIGQGVNTGNAIFQAGLEAAMVAVVQDGENGLQNDQILEMLHDGLNIAEEGLEMLEQIQVPELARAYHEVNVPFIRTMCESMARIYQAVVLVADGEFDIDQAAILSKEANDEMRKGADSIDQINTLLIEYMHAIGFDPEIDNGTGFDERQN